MYKLCVGLSSLIWDIAHWHWSRNNEVVNQYSPSSLKSKVALLMIVTVLHRHWDFYSLCWAFIAFVVHSTLQKELVHSTLRQIKNTFQQTAHLRWQDQIQSTQSTTVLWRFSLTNTLKATTALNNLPRRTQIAINRMRTKTKTARQIIDHKNTCAYCNQDIQCQHVHDLTECPRTNTLRQQLLDKLKPEQHVSNKHQLAINILKSQTQRQYEELQHYKIYKPQR